MIFWENYLYFVYILHFGRVLQGRGPFILTWVSCQIRKIAGAHAPGMPGTFSQPPRVSDPDMHHGTCVTHVPWCMPGSLTSGFPWSRWRGKTFPAFPAHAQPAILCIWQEAHGSTLTPPWISMISNHTPSKLWGDINHLFSISSIVPLKVENW